MASPAMSDSRWAWPCRTSRRWSNGYLATLGLEDTIAPDLDGYVDLAVARAADPACQTAWTRHRTGQPPRAITVGASHDS